MINSMTGFGRAEAYIQGIKITVEIRSVNHRYHEIMFKMPKDLLIMEDQMRKTIQSHIKRGRVDVFVTIDSEENPLQQLKVDWNLANQYIEVVTEFKKRLQIEGQLDFKDFLAIPDLFHVGQDILDAEKIGSELINTVETACNNLVEMRMREGINLYEDLVKRISTITKLLESLQERAPFVVEEYRERLMNRINDWLDGTVELDEARLMNEVAFFSDRANVDEEMTRLKSHFQQFLAILEQKEPVGRKLDFLIQEMNREVNTIGSKANDIILSQMVVELKSELEKMREQVQNVE